jgi:hypothetical protein
MASFLARRKPIPFARSPSASKSELFVLFEVFHRATSRSERNIGAPPPHPRQGFAPLHPSQSYLRDMMLARAQGVLNHTMAGVG